MDKFQPIILKCARCHYEWTPRKDPAEIKECPACKTYCWNEPKLNKTK